MLFSLEGKKLDILVRHKQMYTYGFYNVSPRDVNPLYDYSNDTLMASFFPAILLAILRIPTTL